MTEKKAYLVLENGMVFEGYRFGAERCVTGELVFTTSMGGYIETLTDPSCYGQIVMQTFPLIGNYGVIKEDCEGECALTAYIVQECCQVPSNFRTDMTLDEFMREQNIPGLAGVDTRYLTRVLREQGTMNACIIDTLPADLDAIAAYRTEGAVEHVTCKEIKTYGSENAAHRVALYDLGVKRSVIKALTDRDCRVTVYPATATAGDILSGKPDGVVISNGPGAPDENADRILQVGQLMGKVPMLGLGLGHLLMALAQGGQALKLTHGHHGANQPAKELATGRTYMTAQGHTYAVQADTVKNGKIAFVNVNDGSCEGMEYSTLSASSVQFAPEACAGPHDTLFIFDKFVSAMTKE